MKKSFKRKEVNGLTLVELLAVIVILAIILVIAVPKVMDVINDSKKATLESTAKMIASAAEKAKVQNTVLGKTEEITCDSVAKINDLDYEDCKVDFEDNTAKVTIKGSGKFAGLHVCNGDKTSATATSEECSGSGNNQNTAANYITGLLAEEETKHNGLVQTSVEYEGTTYDAGIRYVGALTGDNAVKNQVYFNCEPTDGTNAYGSENYDYANNCEIWRIIGVFEVKDENGDKVQRLKIINTNSTFKASWDSSASDVNSGKGINQWGSSGSYEGADLMQLLNGYYIGKTGSECKYNNSSKQSGFAQTCTAESLTSSKMKPLTSVALSMSKSAVWDTYAVSASLNPIRSSNASTAYLQEKGISSQYTGISECSRCSDGVERTTSWTGLVGLMSLSDMTYANGWLYNGTIYSWSISSNSYSTVSRYVWRSISSSASNTDAHYSYGVWPALYLDYNVQIIGGEGVDGNAYKLT